MTLWKRIIGILFRFMLVAAIIIPIGYFLAIDPAVLLIVIASLLGLWQKRRHLGSIINQAKVIITILVVTSLFLGFLLWYTHGNLSTSVSLILTVLAIVVMAIGLYGREPISPKSKTARTFVIEEEALPVDEQQACPSCGAVISQSVTSCDWCGNMLYGEYRRR